MRHPSGAACTRKTFDPQKRFNKQGMGRMGANRVIRGGSWNNNARNVRAAYRGHGAKGSKPPRGQAMKIRIFNIPIHGGQDLEDELNSFLSGRRIVFVEKRFVDAGLDSAWTFCVTWTSF